jgi:hypothetical protein
LIPHFFTMPTRTHICNKASNLGQFGNVRPS